MAKKSTIRQNKYDKKHTEFIGLKLNKETDKDILDKIHETMQKEDLSKQGAIKKIIRKQV